MADRTSRRTSSALPRPLDLTFASNRLAVVGLLGAAGLGRLTGRSWRQALGVGISAFLGWATARELDPDHEHSAALALGLSGLISLLQTPSSGAGDSRPAPGPPLLPALTALSALRSLTATVGAAVSPQDALALSAQAAIVSVTGTAATGSQVAALLPAAALALSAAQNDEFSPEATWNALLAGGAGLLPGRQTQGLTRPAPHLLSDLLSLAALSLGAALVAPEPVLSHCDRVPRPVSARRLQASRALALGALATALLRRESASLLPLAAATLATGIRRRLSADRTGTFNL